jgi:hypothetical protein
VYAVVEVKTTLDRANLTQSLTNIADLRQLSARKQYVRVVPHPNDDGTGMVGRKVVVDVGLAPRSYIFAFRQRGLAGVDVLEEQLRAVPSHVHGLCIVADDRFTTQVAFTNPARFTHSADALPSLIWNILTNLNEYPMGHANLEAYLNAPEAPQPAAEPN